MHHEPDPPPFDPTNWQEALQQWIKDTPPAPPARLLSGRIPLGWWEEAFTYRPNSSEKRGHPCGAHQMLTIIAYDITDRKRLTKVAKFCEDHGNRPWTSRALAKALRERGWRSESTWESKCVWGGYAIAPTHNNGEPF